MHESSVNIRNETEMPDISSLSISEENNSEAGCSEKSIKLHDSLSEAITLNLPEFFKIVVPKTEF